MDGNNLRHLFLLAQFEALVYQWKGLSHANHFMVMLYLVKKGAKLELSNFNVNKFES